MTIDDTGAGGAGVPPADVATALVDVLSRADRRVTGRLTGILAAEGSTVDEWRVLSLLARRGRQSMSAIASALLLAPPTLTKRIDGMVADGLIYRRVDDTDRRRVLVLLAPRGRAAHGRLADQVSQEEARVAELASGSGLDVAQITRLLGELIGALDDEKGPHDPEPAPGDVRTDGTARLTSIAP